MPLVLPHLCLQQSPPLLDIPWHATTPSVVSAHTVALPSQSKYLLHIIPLAYLPHDNVADSSELMPPPPGASGYHPQFQCGILVTLQSTLQAQSVVIAREYALQTLPSAWFFILSVWLPRTMQPHLQTRVPWYRKVVVAQRSLGPGRKVTGSVGNLSSLASY